VICIPFQDKNAHTLKRNTKNTSETGPLTRYSFKNTLFIIIPEPHTIPVEVKWAIICLTKLLKRLIKNVVQFVFIMRHNSNLIASTIFYCISW